MHSAIVGSVLHTQAVYGIEDIRLNHVFCMAADDFSEGITEFAKRVMQVSVRAARWAIGGLLGCE